MDTYICTRVTQCAGGKLNMSFVINSFISLLFPLFFPSLLFLLPFPQSNSLSYMLQTIINLHCYKSYKFYLNKTQIPSLNSLDYWDIPQPY